MASSGREAATAPTAPRLRRRNTTKRALPNYDGSSDVEMGGLSDAGSEDGLDQSDSEHDFNDDESEEDDEDLDVVRSESESIVGSDSDSDLDVPSSKKQKLMSKVPSSQFRTPQKAKGFMATPDPTPTKTVYDEDYDDEPNYILNRPKQYKKIFKDNFTFKSGMNPDSPPMSTLEAMFGHMTNKAIRKGFDKVLLRLDGLPINIATMCSGTESPILGLRMVAQQLEKLPTKQRLQVKHLFSAEIVAWKQAFIQANFAPPVIFRDILEMSAEPENGKDLKATTAYGGKAIVPGDVDLLIAGFCCVDFSTLNTRQKALEDLGESGCTLFSIIAYAKKFLPKLVILENVQKATWTDDHCRGGQKSIASYWDDIGYATSWIEVDSKNYYVPQTRVRGYMLCVRKIHFDTEKVLNAKLANFKELVVQFESPASAPVEDFLFKNDHPILKAISAEGSFQVGKYIKRLLWEKCQIGHEIYRYDLGLGKKRPVTHWDRDGSTNNLDFSQPFPEQSERVSDTRDVNHLRSVRRGGDDRYLSRNVDFSQNTFRTTDVQKTGIVSCFTPSNLQYNTVRGGRITGLEGLGLQGLPVRQLDLSQLVDNQLRDLAGNAMTSTVVTAVILAGLIVFYEILNIERREAILEKPLDASMPGEKKLFEKFADPAEFLDTPVSKLVESVSRTARLCYCEGREEKVSTEFQRCQLCKHTTCIKCRRNPKHKYEPIDQWVTASRLNPADTEVLVKDSLPKKISFSGVFDIEKYLQEFNSAYKDRKTQNFAVKMVKDALLSEVQYRGARRREVWDFEFDSTVSKLVLTISEFGAQWLLYSKVPDNLLVSDAARKHFSKHPIARMKPYGELIIEGEWEFWVPQVHDFPVTITSSGLLVEAFQSKIGLEKHIGELVFSNINIEFQDHQIKEFISRDLDGDFKHSPDCGQAFDSTHIRTTGEKGDSQPLLLFFDHEGHTGDPNDHSYVLTLNGRRLDVGERRDIFARFPTTWRQYVTRDKSLKEHREQSIISLDGHWIKLQGYGIASSVGLELFMYNHIPSDVYLDQKASCTKHHAVLTCELSLDSSALSVPNDKWIPVDRNNQEIVFRHIAWALEKGKVLDGHKSENLRKMDEWQVILCDDAGRCEICAPQAPPLLWTFEPTSKGNRKAKQIPFEMPEAATDFEIAHKARPSGMSTLFRKNTSGTVEVKIGINPKTLVHRASALLALEGSSSDIETSWCLVTDDIVSLRPRLDPFILLNTKDEEFASQPPGFSTNVKLRPEQCKKLTWMINQEQGAVFTEREFVETRAPRLGYLVMGQAKRERVVRGGILADEVGFGKTVVILALILSRRTADENFARRDIPGHIPTKATVIFIPGHLSKQWKREAEKFLAKTPKRTILVIETVSQLSKLKVEDFMKAAIIIVNCSVCQSEQYVLALAQLSGMVEPSSTASSRAKSAWSKTAYRSLERTVDILKTDPKRIAKYLRDKFDQSLEEAKAHDLPIPSKRYTGSRFQEEQNKRKRGGAKKPNVEIIKERIADSRNLKALKNCDDLKFPVFEMFGFARVVVDEINYVKQAESITVMNVLGNSYWGLSGTPLKEGFPDVKTMARFLQINLGADDYSRMKRDVYVQAQSEMTASEIIQTYQPPSSPAFEERRHAHAGIFLDTFVRQDFADIGPIVSSSTIHLVDQSISQAGNYYELEQSVVAKKFELKAKPSSQNDTDKQINESLAKCPSGKSALLLRASYSSILHDKHSNREPENSLDALKCVLGIRERQRNGIENEIARLLDEAVWIYRFLDGKDAIKHFDTFYNRVHTQSFRDHDPEVTKKVINLIDTAIDEYHANNTIAFHDFVNDDNALQNTTATLTKRVNELVRRTRALRFFRSMLRIHQHSALCDYCGQGANKVLPQHWNVLSSCGHILCAASCTKFADANCPVAGCSASCASNQLIHGDELPQEQEQIDYHPFGEKLRQITQLINNTDDDDQVLVFVQSDALRLKVVDALKYEGISFTDLKSGGQRSSAADKLNNFQFPAAGDPDKVLILNIGDESASGSNLTMANHIIFVAPYLTVGSSGQQTYDAARTQALGRACRFGQKKHVHIYDFVTAYSIDADIIEKRSHKILKPVPLPFISKHEEKQFGYALVGPELGEPSIYGSRIARLIFPGDQDQ